MEAMKCGQCGRKYTTKSGLRRHMKAEHLEVVAEVSNVIVPGATNDLTMGDIFGPAELPKGAGRKVLDRALKALGIEPENVLSYAVHDDRVVIIEGPVGYKRVYEFPGGRGVKE